MWSQGDSFNVVQQAKTSKLLVAHDIPGKSARPQPRFDAERIAELERKIEQQAMEIDFLKKALRRFREHPLRVLGVHSTAPLPLLLAVEEAKGISRNGKLCPR